MRPLPHARQRHQGYVLPPVEHDVLVNLVADRIGVVGDGQFGDQRKLLAVEDLRRRVHRVVEKDRLGLRSEGRGKGILVELPFRRRHPHQLRRRTGSPDKRQVAVVERLDQHHLVAGLDQRRHAVGERLRSAGSDEDLRLPVDVEVVEPLVGLRDGGPQFRDAHHRRILVPAARDDLLGGETPDILRPVDIRESLPEVDRAVFLCEPRHHLEDAGRQPRIDRIGRFHESPSPLVRPDPSRMARRAQSKAGLPDGKSWLHGLVIEKDEAA